MNQKLNQQKVEEVIDLEGLSEEEIRRVKELVEFFKSKKERRKEEKIELRTWDLGKIRGNLSREEIYDWL